MASINGSKRRNQSKPQLCPPATKEFRKRFSKKPNASVTAYQDATRAMTHGIATLRNLVCIERDTEYSDLLRRSTHALNLLASSLNRKLSVYQQRAGVIG